MWTLYLDEVGHDGEFVPANPSTSPLFGLGGFALHHDRLRSIAGKYFELKRKFYKAELSVYASQAALIRQPPPKGKEATWKKQKQELGVDGLPESQWGRVERFEIKGRDLASLLVLKDPTRFRREILFAISVLELIEQHAGFIFARVKLKKAGPAEHRDSLYGGLAQGIIDDFHRFLSSKSRSDGYGIVVIDERNKPENCSFLAYAQSYIFSRELGQIAETPFLVDSRWFPGIQIADNIAGILHSILKYRHAGADFDAYGPAEEVFAAGIDGLTWSDGDHWKSVFVHKQHSR